MSLDSNIKEFNNILPLYFDNGRILDCIRIGNGHIHDTYKVTIKSGDLTADYLVQKINTAVFTDPEALMSNMRIVVDHLREKTVKNGGDIDREVIHIIPAKDGNLYCTDNNSDCWRVLTFIQGIICNNYPLDWRELESAAFAFGQFSGMLADLDTSLIVETIPHFHDTPKRYATLMKAFAENSVNRADKVKEEILFASDRQKYTLLLQQSNIPLRVTHNDTKYNNVLLDKDTHEVICVIDLDTVMPGYSVTDFGDMIRFGVNTANEDEADLDKVKVSLEHYEACLSGYIRGCGGQLTEQELLLLPDGARMMTLECGMRFLTDYLQGDRYFHTDYAEHNLVRCRNQFKLLSELERLDPEIRKIVKKYL